jgi:chemotaxis protein methyltransferase CheR
MLTALKDLTMKDLKEMRLREFEKFARLVYEASGIKLEPQKLDLLQSRLQKRLRALSIPSFKQYYEFLASDGSGQELVKMLDCVTTNKTEFFREPKHFEHLMGTVFPLLRRNAGGGGDGVRIWSAACSTGEEVYGLAMCALEALGEALPVKVLGTDLSTRVLAQAMEGRYENAKLGNVPPGWIAKYFHPEESNKSTSCRVGHELKEVTRFSRLNLNGGDLPFRSKFDVIFCRNVMIYFDQQVQQGLVEKLAGALKSGGFLYTGLSESLLRVRHGLKHVAPSVYLKP